MLYFVPAKVAFSFHWQKFFQKISIKNDKKQALAGQPAAAPSAASVVFLPCGCPFERLSGTNQKRTSGSCCVFRGFCVILAAVRQPI